LDKAGVNRELLFPGLDGFAESLSLRTPFWFQREKHLVQSGGRPPTNRQGDFDWRTFGKTLSVDCPDDRVAAFHEAGHALAAVANNMTIHCVHLGKCMSAGGHDLGGWTDIEFTPQDDEDLCRYAVFTFAGSAAESRETKRSFNEVWESQKDDKGKERDKIQKCLSPSQWDEMRPKAIKRQRP
jgi:hypothetical protein